MQFGDIEGQRREAQPGLLAACPSCGATMIAKCGDHRRWHWAHRGVRACDSWWEPETEWHRCWKNEFPQEWQEIVHTSPGGEKHIADVKTPGGTVIEFQHSFLNAEERVSREAFYRNMVWVVDGRRRKRDAAQLLKCIGPCVYARDPFILYVTNHEECALLRDWHSCSVPVYFDLGVREEDGKPIFWRLDPVSRVGRAYLTPVSRDSFVKVHRGGRDTEKTFSEGIGLIVEGLRRTAQRPQPLLDFRRYAQRRRGFGRRF